MTLSKFSITPNKIEISLQKATPGMKWLALEGAPDATHETQDASASSPDTVVSKPADAPATAAAAAAKAPSYPTSSRTGPKNWDALATEALRKENAAASANPSADADADDDLDDLDEADPLNGFFKKIYKDANPDTKRAMMKSYIESNGTALSTNWEEVNKGVVEVRPPEGVEAKKWEG